MATGKSATPRRQWSEAKSFSISSEKQDYAEDVVFDDASGAYEYAISGWCKLPEGGDA
jgi:hypothetical protein